MLVKEALDQLAAAQSTAADPNDFLFYVNPASEIYSMQTILRHMVLQGKLTEHDLIDEQAGELRIIGYKP